MYFQNVLLLTFPIWSLRKRKQFFYYYYCFGVLFLGTKDIDDFYFCERSERKPIDDRLEKFSDYLLENCLTTNSIHSPPFSFPVQCIHVLNVSLLIYSGDAQIHKFENMACYYNFDYILLYVMYLYLK